MTDPIALAQLRHLYQNMVNGAVRDTASAKRIAEGLLAPAVEALERATPTAEQQVIIDFDQVGTAGPFHVVNGRVKLPDATMRDLARMLRPTYEAEQAAPKAAPAPQQEAQEPAFVDVSLRTAIAKAVYQQVRVEFDYRLGSWTALDADEQQRIVDSIRGLYAAPQPAPAPLSDDAKDAARWRMAALIGNEVMLRPDKRTHATAVKAYMDATHSGSDLTAAVDAAIAAQGGKA